MSYTVKNTDGEAIAGDLAIDDVLKASALIANGWIDDSAGTVVYESARRRELREANDLPE